MIAFSRLPLPTTTVSGKPGLARLCHAFDHTPYARSLTIILKLLGEEVKKTNWQKDNQ